MPRAVAALALVVVVVLGGIAAYYFLYEGAVAVSVKDAPMSTWSHVNVTFSGVQIHESGKDNASWVTVFSGSKTVDLAALTNVSELLGSTRLAPGHYEQIRISVVSATGVDAATGQSVTFMVPPDNATAKIAGQFTISSGQTTTVTVDFALSRCIRQVNGTWEFDPVLGQIA
ncbi:MAG TPA: DUF4382 domain-containing protein [Thermoplasmata archaeon]